MRERDVERYLVKSVTDMGGKIEKVQWLGRRNAPDRVLMLRVGNRFGRYATAPTIWVEVKNPDTIKTFPANAHERAQAREHQRMRNLGQVVVVVGTVEQVDEVLA